MLVNFKVDPESMQRLLPSRFSPKLHKGYAVAGICLIRLELFSSLSEASAFFESGSLGYSVTGDAKRLDGLVLETKQGHVEALDVY